jgi:hypothetical protein
MTTVSSTVYTKPTVGTARLMALALLDPEKYSLQEPYVPLKGNYIYALGMVIYEVRHI